VRKRQSMTGWQPADNASRETLLFLQKWQRRDLYFNGTFALVFLGFTFWNIWLATHGSPWSWLGAAIDFAVMCLYSYRARRAFDRWLICQEILTPEPNPD